MIRAKPRVIDGMSAKEIMEAWMERPIGYSLVSFLADVCEPAPDWRDGLSRLNPVLCFVGDTIDELEQHRTVEWVVHFNPIPEVAVYETVSFAHRRYAKPVKLSDCWTPPVIGEL
jgi:hypothetical protein